MTRFLEAVVVFPDGVPPAATLGQATHDDGAELPPLAPGACELWSLPAAEVPSLLLRCVAVDGRPLDRPSPLCRTLARLTEAGATSAWLPAAQRWLDAEAMRGSPRAGGLAIRHEVHRATDVWLHTHGLELYGLPDLACAVTTSELALGRGLLDDAVAYLLDGGDALAPDRVLEAPGADGRLLRFAVEQAALDPDHPYGELGAWNLRLGA